MTIKETFANWQAWRLSRLKITPQTADRLDDDYFHFLRGTSIEQRDPADVTREELWDFCDSIFAQEKLREHSWMNLKSLINGAFDYARRTTSTIDTRLAFRDYIVPVGRLIVKNRRKTRADIRANVFMPEDVEAIKAAISDSTDPLDIGIRLCFMTGLRVCELSALKPQDIDEDILTVQRMERRHKEGGSYVYTVEECTKANAGARDVVLIREAQDLIGSLKSGEYLFERSGKRIRGTYFSRKLRDVCRKVGISAKGCHAIRKTYCSQLLNAGMPLAEVQHLMGHTSPRTTLSAYYYNNSSILSMQETLEAAVGRFVK
jgi:integrase